MQKSVGLIFWMEENTSFKNFILREIFALIQNKPFFVNS